MKQRPINFVVALPSEARPLIDFFRLKKKSGLTAFSVFENSNEQISLIISGLGKIKAAAAATFIFLHTGSQPFSFFLNVGISGGVVADFGHLALIHKITDQVTQQSVYPFMVSKQKIMHRNLLTCDVPQTIYPPECLVDMEAYGFFQAANLLVTKEHIQVCKIVSDHDEKTRSELKPSKVEQLIETQISHIHALVCELRQFSQQYIDEYKGGSSFNILINQWHFTEYQSYELRELLRRWAVILPHQNPVEALQNLKNAKHILQELKSRLDHTNYAWNE